MLLTEKTYFLSNKHKGLVELEFFTTKSFQLPAAFLKSSDMARRLSDVFVGICICCLSVSAISVELPEEEEIFNPTVVVTDLTTCWSRDDAKHWQKYSDNHVEFRVPPGMDVTLNKNSTDISRSLDDIVTDYYLVDKTDESADNHNPIWIFSLREAKRFRLEPYYWDGEEVIYYYMPFNKAIIQYSFKRWGAVSRVDILGNGLIVSTTLISGEKSGLAFKKNQVVGSLHIKEANEDFSTFRNRVIESGKLSQKLGFLRQGMNVREIKNIIGQFPNEKTSSAFHYQIDTELSGFEQRLILYLDEKNCFKGFSEDSFMFEEIPAPYGSLQWIGNSLFENMDRLSFEDFSVLILIIKKKIPESSESDFYFLLNRISNLADYNCPPLYREMIPLVCQRIKKSKNFGDELGCLTSDSTFAINLFEYQEKIEEEIVALAKKILTLTAKTSPEEWEAQAGMSIDKGLSGFKDEEMQAFLKIHIADLKKQFDNHPWEYFRKIGRGGK